MKILMKTLKTEPLLYRVTAAADMLSISRSQMYKLIDNGTIAVVRIGKSVRIPAESIRSIASQSA
jgi:excisionase family DNA binding protein